MIYSDADLLWLAGLWEGEGCFSYNGYGYVLCMIRMTDEDIINHVASLLNRWLPVHGNRERPINVKKYAARTPKGEVAKDAFGVTITHRRALQLMMLLRPYMGERRRARIDELLDLELETQLSRKPVGTNQWSNHAGD